MVNYKSNTTSNFVRTTNLTESNQKVFNWSHGEQRAQPASGVILMQTMSIGIDDSTLDLIHSNVNSNHINNSNLSQEISLSMVTQQQQQQQQISSRLNPNQNAITELSHNISHSAPSQSFLTNNQPQPSPQQQQQQQQKITSENLETINDKKRKLTLPLLNAQSSPSEPSSISSSDSITVTTSSTQSSNPSTTTTTAINNNTTNNSTEFTPATKRQKYFTHDSLITANFATPSFSHFLSTTETPSQNKDLVNHLDQCNKLNTPQIEKFLHDLNNSGHGLLKTPGSALAFLTPNNSLSFNQFYFAAANTDDNNNNPNAANSNTNNNSLIINNDTHQYSGIINNNNNNNANNNNQALNKRNEEQNSINNHHAQLVDCSNLININPNIIFSNNLNQPQQQQPKYTTLINVNDATNSANNDYLVNFNNANNPTNNHRNNDELINLVNKNNVNNNVQPVVKSNEIAYDAASLLAVGVKDELQTVPVYSNHVNNALNPVNTSNKLNKSKRKGLNNNNNNNNSSVLKNVNIVNGGNGVSSNGSTKGMMKVNEGCMAQANGLSSRRDTDNSTSSSTNLDSYSPINLDEQEQIKLEKKRERNREAARKCRTRKLEKIATLEEQVKTLTESNGLEKAKTEALRDEINRLKQKLEVHQKLHNCDLKINF